MTMRPARISATMSCTGEMGAGVRGVFMGAFVGGPQGEGSLQRRFPGAGAWRRRAPRASQRTCDAALPHGGPVCAGARGPEAAILDQRGRLCVP
jgi:hypothetical protein